MKSTSYESYGQSILEVDKRNHWKPDFRGWNRLGKSQSSAGKKLSKLTATLKYASDLNALHVVKLEIVEQL